MAYNIPNYDTTRLSFGPGILYMGAPGTTPLIDVGSVNGDSELIIDRTVLEVKQGSPMTIIKRYATEEKVNFKINGIEWNLNNLAYCMGAGITIQNGATEQLDFGGDINFNNRALRFVHQTPDGSTIDLHLFNSQGVGKIQVSFKEKDTHTLPLEFIALDGTVDFTNTTLVTNKKRFRIMRTKA